MKVTFKRKSDLSVRTNICIEDLSTEQRDTTQEEGGLFVMS